MGNLRHKRAKKLAQVYMASEGQGWDRNLCLHPIVLGVGRANTTADGKVLGRLQGALAQEVLLMRPLLDAGPQTGPGATFYHPLSITSSSFPAGMGVGAGSQNNRRSKEKVQACWVFAGVIQATSPLAPASVVQGEGMRICQGCFFFPSGFSCSENR